MNSSFFFLCVDEDLCEFFFYLIRKGSEVKETVYNRYPTDTAVFVTSLRQWALELFTV